MKTTGSNLIQRIYDSLGKGYDLFSIYEGKAKEAAMQLLAPQPQESILNAGIGSGREQLSIIKGVGDKGFAVGLDISHKLARISLKRTNMPQVQASLISLPFQQGCFDAMYCTYVFDLLSFDDIHKSIDQMSACLSPGGRLVLCSLTRGDKGLSLMITKVWDAIFRINPNLCAGCRPINLLPFLKEHQLNIIEERIITQLGITSQVVLAEKNC